MDSRVYGECIYFRACDPPHSPLCTAEEEAEKGTAASGQDGRRVVLTVVAQGTDGPAHDARTPRGQKSYLVAQRYGPAAVWAVCGALRACQGKRRSR